MNSEDFKPITAINADLSNIKAVHGGGLAFTMVLSESPDVKWKEVFGKEAGKSFPPREVDFEFNGTALNLVVAKANNLSAYAKILVDRVIQNTNDAYLASLQSQEAERERHEQEDKKRKERENAMVDRARNELRRLFPESK